MIGDTHLFVEVVKTPEERSRGLMYRNHLDWDSGMLFVYPGPRQMVFWMKNTYIPLSIAFIDEDKTWSHKDTTSYTAPPPRRNTPSR